MAINKINNSSIPLSKALRIFSNPIKWREYKAVEISTEETFKGIGTMLGALINGIWGDEEAHVKSAKDMESIKGYGRKIKPGSDALRALESAMILRLLSGELVAEGYFSPRHPNDKRIEIPCDVWGGYPSIKWHSDTVKGQGMEFTHVLVSLPIQSIASSISEVLPIKKQGRPSVKHYIEEAYDSLRESDSVNYDAPKSALYGPICDWLSIRYPDRSNEFKKLSDSTIRKAISKRFDLDRSK